MLLLLSPAKSLDYASPLPAVEATHAALRRGGAGDRTGGLEAGAEEAGRADEHLGQAREAQRRPLCQLRRTGGAARALRLRGRRPMSASRPGPSTSPRSAFAQDHVRILSGLYGLLRPLDLIRPYRLEMGTRWAPGRKKNLYQLWGSKISDALAADLLAEGSDVVINCASKEYWHAVEQAPPRGIRIITMDFRELAPQGLVFNSFGAKRARGMMARWMSEHRITDPDGLKGFDSDGYAFTADGSDDSIWRFVKPR